MVFNREVPVGSDLVSVSIAYLALAYREPAKVTQTIIIVIVE